MFWAVYGEWSFRQIHTACNIVASLHPVLYVIDSKRALNFGEAQLLILAKHNAVQCPFWLHFR
jgi:hypothetical protein